MAGEILEGEPIKVLAMLDVRTLGNFMGSTGSIWLYSNARNRLHPLHCKDLILFRRPLIFCGDCDVKGID